MHGHKEAHQDTGAEGQVAAPVGPDAAGGGALRRYDRTIGLLLGVLAGVVLCLRLGSVYLWQDEAATAVLGERMIHFGKPLAFDGRNLITMDHYLPDQEEAVRRASVSAGATVRYCAEQHHFKADSTWIGQPWGQFLVAGLSLRLLGHGTTQARLPFALAGVATCVLLYVLARRLCRQRATAVFAVLLLLLNVYWVLHTRQCRYYALSTLLLVTTLLGYRRWRLRLPWGAAAFVASSWLWFQTDYGTFWPAMVVLGVCGLVHDRPRWAGTLGVFAVVGGAVAPWVWYYELWHRKQPGAPEWGVLLERTVYGMNQYIMPLALLAAVPLVLWLVRRRLVPGAGEILLAGAGLLLALQLWVPAVAPAFFHRYLVAVTPLGCLLLAWLLEEGIAGLRLLHVPTSGCRLAAVAAAAVLVLTPWLEEPVGTWLGQSVGLPPAPAAILKPELAQLRAELAGDRPDPNRATITWLRAHAHPGDEVLINYEDIPVMFYTDLAVRGGIMAYRVLDNAAGPPSLLVIRRSVGFCFNRIFADEIGLYSWQTSLIDGPDIPWGNIPDPMLRPKPDQVKKERIIGAVRR